ncbi:MAG: hypothetical protein ACW981_13645 [Candidatus Hodarchaeales archaeon]
MNDLESLIDEERKRPKTKRTIKIVEKPHYKPLIVDGLDVANFGAHGFPSMKNIALVLEKCFSDNYEPITVICDSELRYLLAEHEEVKNLDKCDCQFCIAANNQHYLGSENKRAKFFECLPEVDSEREILKIASNSGSRILTNKSFTRFINDYELLGNKNWQIKYKIEKDLVKFINYN